MATTANPGSSVTIDWQWWDKQAEALEALSSCAHDIVVFRGGYGSGKSVLGARWIHQVALTVPKSDSLVLAPDAAKGGPATYRVFFEQLPGEQTVPAQGGDPENSPVVTNYHGTKREITYQNGSVARLGSADRWNRYAGSEFNAVWADEVAHYETTDLYQLNRMLLSRQRTASGPNVTLWTSTGNGYNQFYDFVERQVDSEGDSLTTRIKNVVADSRNNPFLEAKEKLTRQFEGTTAEQQGLAGGFAAAEGLVYPRFSREHHILTAAEAHDRTDDWRMYGYDAGWNDPRVLLEIARTPMGQFAVLDMFYESETDVDDAVAWLSGRPNGTLYCEHEPMHIEQFRRAGWPAEKAEKSLDEGIPAVRSRLDLDGDEPGLLISDDCTPLIQEFLSYQEEHVGKSRAEDHALDALRYAIMTEAHAGDGDSFMLGY